MRIDKDKRIWFSLLEMKVITGVLHVLSYEMWKTEKNKKCRNIKAKFSCSMEDVKYVKDWFASLYSECKQATYIFLFEDAHAKLSVITIALAKCRKHFKEYEVAELGQITQAELNDVQEDFQRLLADLERVG